MKTEADIARQENVFRALEKQYERDLAEHRDDPFVRVTSPYDRELTPEEMRLETWRAMEGFPDRARQDAWRANEKHTAIVQLEAWRQRNPRGGIAALAGDVGTGKTTAATWLSLRVRNPRFKPECIRVSELVRLSMYDEEHVRRWREPRFLVLDDLGAEPTAVHVLDELVDVFYSSSGRWLIITTNLSAKAFAKRFSPRVADRIRAFRGWLAIEGESMRGRGQP